MKDGFAEYHPIVNMCYYVAVIGTAMFVMHPVFVVISFVAAAVYEIYLKRDKGLKFVVLMIPVFVIMSLINPLFSHEGVTLLCYLPTGNPLTLESVVYGLISGLIIVTVIIWFATFNIIMTGDKILCVAGKMFPALGMLLSMVMRFVPKLNNQTKKVIMANQAIEGLAANSLYEGKTKNKLSKAGMKSARLLQGAKCFGIMTTWSLENSVITADSMRARGYGCGKRTSFSIYSFQNRDIVLIVIIAILFVWNIRLYTAGILKFNCYPTIVMTGANGLLQGVCYYAPQVILCFLPMFINVKEDIKWHRFQSRI